MLRGKMSRDLYNRFRILFAHRLSLDSLYKLHQLIGELSQVVEDIYDCCVNICCCYTGLKKDLVSCPHCKEPRFDPKGHARQSFRYLPFTSRLKSMFLNKDLATAMNYRSTFDHGDDEINDVFDGFNYQELLREPVIIDGVEQPYRFFSQRYDVAVGLLTDGFQVFKRVRGGTATCWPVALVNFNMPPELRSRLEYVIELGVIPGPNAPIDFNSFLQPFVDECKQMAVGVNAFNAATNKIFTLRVYPISCHGDMQAIKHLMCFKGSNGICPCRSCEIKGIRDKSKTRSPYYAPLNPPTSFGRNARAWSGGNLPMRTETRIKTQLDAINSATTATARNKLRQQYGINEASILAEIPSIKMTRSFPHDFMHLDLENHGKNLVLKWQGKFKPDILGPGEITDGVWECIGQETAAAGATIPATFGRRTPNIWSERHNFTAEDWSFWLVYIAPHVLLGRFKQPKFYKHFMKFNRMLRMSLQYSTTKQEREELRALVIDYVEEYERYI